MKVVTVLTNQNQQGFNLFLKPSCDYFDLDLIVLNYDGPYVSHRIKDALLSSYLQNTSRSEIIIFTDGHDTAFLTGEKEISLKYKSFQSPLVFSAEINCWPDEKISHAYPISDHSLKYLNCGGFIGEAGFIADLYKAYPLFPPASDQHFYWSNQYYWHNVYLNNSPDIRLDHYCQLFYNTAILYEKIKTINFRSGDPRIDELYVLEKSRLDEEIEFVHNRLRLKNQNTLPCHIHFPGPVSKSLMANGYFDPIKVWEK